MNRFFILFLIVGITQFTACNSTTDESPKAKRGPASSQPVYFTKNIFNQQNGVIRCFHDKTEDKSYEIACHPYLKQEDGTLSLADFVAKGVTLNWNAPEVDPRIPISSFSCNPVGLGYRCELTTVALLTEAEEDAAIQFSVEAMDANSSVNLKMIESVFLTKLNRIPTELDAVMIEGPLTDTSGLTISHESKTELIGSPFVDIPTRGPALLSEQKIRSVVPTPLVQLNPEWFDKEDLQEKARLVCKQIGLSDDAAEEEAFQKVAFSCQILLENDLKESLKTANVKLEGFSFPEGATSNRLLCDNTGGQFRCEGEVLKASQNGTPFARFEARISVPSKQFHLLIQTLPLKLSSSL